LVVVATTDLLVLAPAADLDVGGGGVVFFLVGEE